jgi:hypothetical protein
MTPKEKAKELFDKMSKQTYSFQEYAGAHYTVEEIGWEGGQKCALIAVDEIINNVLVGIDLASTWGNYWQEVKQEIENL